MANLSIYVGTSKITALFLDENTAHQFYEFPYAFPPGFFNLQSKETFYSQIFNHILDQFNAKDIESSLHTVWTTLLGEHVLLSAQAQENHISVALSNMLSKHIMQPVLYVEKSYIFSSKKQSQLYADECVVITQNQNEDLLGNTEYLNTSANFDVYTFVHPASKAEMSAFDTSMRKLAMELTPQSPNETKSQKLKPEVFDIQNIIFGGSRFFSDQVENFLPQSGLLMLDLLPDFGVYTLKYDGVGYMPHVAALNEFKIDISDRVDYSNMGTLLKVPGPVDVLVSSAVGTSQLIETPADSISAMPLAQDATARILIKSKEFDSVEKTVVGGKMGLVIDTRVPHTSQEIQDLKNYSTNQKKYLEVLNQNRDVFTS